MKETRKQKIDRQRGHAADRAFDPIRQAIDHGELVIEGTGMTDQAIRDLKNAILTAINDVLQAEPENCSIARGTINGKDFYKLERPIGVVEMGTKEEPQPSQGWQTIATAPKGSGKEGPQDTRHPDYVEPPTLWLVLEDGTQCAGYWDWYYAEDGMGYDGGSAWVEKFSSERISPTHWMANLPLPPSPPSGAAQ